MPSKSYLNEFDELNVLLNDIAGRPIGYKRRLRFATEHAMNLYRNALYTRRLRAKKATGMDPWGDITIRADKKTFTLTLERYTGRPKWLPTPIDDRSYEE